VLHKSSTSQAAASSLLIIVRGDFVSGRASVRAFCGSPTHKSPRHEMPNVIPCGATLVLLSSRMPSDAGTA